MSETGAQMNWDQDFTGTSVIHILAKGKKHFFVVEPREKEKPFEKWLAIATKS